MQADVQWLAVRSTPVFSERHQSGGWWRVLCMVEGALYGGWCFVWWRVLCMVNGTLRGDGAGDDAGDGGVGT